MLTGASGFPINEDELIFEFIRASGPGGQNVNKVATGVQLRFDVRNSPSLAEAIKNRLVHLAGSRVTKNGILLIEAKRFRTQEKNRADAILRLQNLINKAEVLPKTRRSTTPSAAVRARRVDSKKRRGAVKKNRGTKIDNED